MTEHATTELARTYWDVVWGERKVELIDELMTDPYTVHSSTGTVILSRAQVKRELERLWQTLYDAVTVIDEMTIAGDKIWLRATTKVGDLVIGQQSVRTWMILHRVADNRLAESWSAMIPGIDWSTPALDLRQVHPDGGSHLP
jgi:SnoaL-like domain